MLAQEIIYGKKSLKKNLTMLTADFFFFFFNSGKISESFAVY